MSSSTMPCLRVLGGLLAGVAAASWPTDAEEAPDHSPRWVNGELAYGIADDLAGRTYDGKRHDSPGYKYYHCRKGVCQECDLVLWPENDADLGFSPLSGVDPSNHDWNVQRLFIMWAGYDPMDPLALVYESQPNYAFLKGSRFDFPRERTTWSTSRAVVSGVADRHYYYLFRYLNFPTQLVNVAANTPVDSRSRKLIVLIHGWNPGSTPNPYEAGQLRDLSRNLQDRLRSDPVQEWALVEYNWARDADTGFIGAYPDRRGPQKRWDTWPMQNGTEAAETAHMHGQHLGELLHAEVPAPQRVQFIAHSAGAWCARTAARHLLEVDSTVQVQVTLLDPFIPNPTNHELLTDEAESVLSTAVMSELGGLAANQRIPALENYYSENDTGPVSLPGTQEAFEWGTRAIQRRIDWTDQVGGGVAYRYGDHSGPIEFYADSVTETGLLTLPSCPYRASLAAIGWRQSLFMKEPVVAVATQPLGPNMDVGTNVVLSATATTREKDRYPEMAAPVFTYQWRKDDADIPGATGATYMIGSIQPGHAGGYTCAVTHLVDGADSPMHRRITTVSQTVTLTVTGAGSTLDNPVLSPATGVTTTTFTWSVHYRDPGGAAPQSTTLCLDGNAIIMPRTAGNAADGTYSLQIPGLAAGPHNYYFEFRSNNGTPVRLPPQSATFAGPTVSSGGTGGNIHVRVWWGENGEDRQGGTVVPDIGFDTTFNIGDALWFTAFPKFGWEVSSWAMRWIWNQSPGAQYWVSVDDVRGNSGFMYVKDSDAVAPLAEENAIKCYFRRIAAHASDRVLTVSKVGPGNVTPDVGFYYYAMDAPVTVRATPINQDAIFVEWQLDGTTVSSTTSYDFSIGSGGDREIRAVFSYRNTVEYAMDLPCTANAIICPSRPEHNSDFIDNWGPDKIGIRRWDREGYTYRDLESLLKFDVSLFPTDTTITLRRLELHLWCTRLPTWPYGYEVQENLDDWVESPITNVDPRRSSHTWNEAHTGSTVGQEDPMCLTDMIQDASNWLSKWRTANYGLRIRAHQGHADYNYEGCYTFYSHDYTGTDAVDTASKRPHLHVTYGGPPPGIATDTSQASQRLVKGETPTTQNLDVWNSCAGGILNYTATSDVNWCTLYGTTSGSSNGSGDKKQMTLAFDATGLPIGIHRGTVQITDPKALNNPVTIPVTLEVTGPAISILPASITTEALAGRDPVPVSFEVWNSGAGTLTYSLAKSAGWLSLSEAGNASTPGQRRQVTAQFDATRLTPGPYEDTITITDTNGYASPATVGIPVQLTVYSEQVAAPTFTPSPGAIYLTSVPISISCPTADAAIHYTLDRTVPLPTSTTYSGVPVQVGATTVVRAKAWKDGLLSSSEMAVTYQVYPVQVSVSFGQAGGLGRIKVSWNSPAGVAPPFEVWRNASDDPTGAGCIAKSVQGPTFEDSPVTPGTHYWYWVRTSRTNGFSSSGTCAGVRVRVGVDEHPAGSILAGAPFPMSVFEENSGDTQNAMPFYVHYVLSTDTSASTDDLLVFEDYEFVPLRAGQKCLSPLTGRVPFPAEPGLYHLLAVIDPNSLVTGNRQNDNVWASATPAVRVEPTDTTPDRFVLSDMTGVPTGISLTSDPISISGINAPTPIWVRGGEYSVAGGDFTAAPSLVRSGAIVRLRQTASTESFTTTNVLLCVGDMADDWSVTTQTAYIGGTSFRIPMSVSSVGSDFAFGIKPGASAGFYESGDLEDKRSPPVPPSGNPNAYFSAGGVPARWDIRPPAQTVQWTMAIELSMGAAITVTLRWGPIPDAASGHALTLSGPGLTRALDMRTQSEFSVSSSGFVPVVKTYTITAEDRSDTRPDPFQFADRVSVQPATLLTSDPIYVDGTNAPAPISISGGRYCINGGPYVDVDGLVPINAQVRLQVESAATPLTTSSVALGIGGVSDTWSVTTLPDVRPPAVTMAPATDVTPTRATVTVDVTADGGAPVLFRGVCWGPRPNPTPTVLNSCHLVEQGLGIGGASFRLTGLLPNTTYFARAFASNRAGNQASEQPGYLAGLAYGEVRSFKTALPPAATAVGIEDGWNLVLVTKKVEEAPTPLQNPNLLSDWWFWRFDHYEKATSLAAGTVYWIMAGDATTVNVVGTLAPTGVMPGFVSLTAGWNLIGALEPIHAPAVSPSSVSAGEWWNWSVDRYERSRRLAANAACWIYAPRTAQGQLPEP